MDNAGVDLNKLQSRVNFLALIGKVMVIILAMSIAACNKTSSSHEEETSNEEIQVHEEMVAFSPFENNPVFKGTGADTWDQSIRERGYILKENDGYHLWYTGYRENQNDATMALGYATSPDGIQWTRYKDNPIFSESWVEDMMVVKSDGVYYMFAEGQDDIAHLMTSTDKSTLERPGRIKGQLHQWATSNARAIRHTDRSFERWRMVFILRA